MGEWWNLAAARRERARLMVVSHEVRAMAESGMGVVEIAAWTGLAPVDVFDLLTKRVNR